MFFVYLTGMDTIKKLSKTIAKDDAKAFEKEVCQCSTIQVLVPQTGFVG